MYIYDESYCRLLYSISNFRNNKLDFQMIGRANEYLHFYDVENFKVKGIKLMDWGGISSNKIPNGIDKFKIEFGGELCSYYNMMIGNTLLGKIIILTLKLKELF